MVRSGAMTPQQPTHRLNVWPNMHNFVENVSVLIDDAPGATLVVGGGDDGLAQPDVASPWEPALETTSVVLAEFQLPSPRGFAGNPNSALEEHFFDEA
jgi:hypothetical protein